MTVATLSAARETLHCVGPVMIGGRLFAASAAISVSTTPA